MTEELDKVADEYLDRFKASDLVLVKINDEKYPVSTLKRVLLARIKERGLTGLTSYIFLNELFIEKV